MDSAYTKKVNLVSDIGTFVFMKKSQLTERDMYFGATPEILKLARQLRKNCTATENSLWEELRTENLGVKFRRQHAVGKFIADFYCHIKHKMQNYSRKLTK